MHIQSGKRAMVDQDCPISRFTTMVSAEAISRLTGWAPGRIHEWAKLQGATWHECCGVEYLHGNLLVRLMHGWVERGDQGTEELLDQTTEGLCRLLGEHASRGRVAQWRPLIRHSLAMATALNEGALGRRIDISASLGIAWRRDCAAPIGGSATSGPAGRTRR